MQSQYLSTPPPLLGWPRPSLVRRWLVGTALAGATLMPVAWLRREPASWHRTCSLLEMLQYQYKITIALCIQKVYVELIVFIFQYCDHYL